MAIRIGIKADGIHLTNEQCVVDYQIFGTSDPEAAVAALMAEAPATLRGFPRQDPSMDALSTLHDDGWEASVTYRALSLREETRQKEAAPADEEPVPELQCTISTETLHVSRSLETLGRYYRTLANGLPDYGGLIGVTDDDVKGVDILTGVCTFAIVHYPLTSSVTPEYQSQCMRLVGHTNAEDFGAYEAGELLYMGASYSRRGGTVRTQVTQLFKASPNVADVGGHGFASPVPKDGFDYVWPIYQTKKEDGVNVPSKELAFLFREKVFPDGDFTVLGIPMELLT